MLNMFQTSAALQCSQGGSLVFHALDKQLSALSGYVGVNITACTEYLNFQDTCNSMLLAMNDCQLCSIQIMEKNGWRRVSNLHYTGGTDFESVKYFLAIRLMLDV
ncbi:uncharacterized protein BJ212DRAFT_1312623 [Suillus subaureus]|uniref:Uncharacterized protein n=1 Tax=Suillus subaureus TaxID=48587 RepID=A0A9P7EQU2_9AGAM|nr:uncharacterized protein BJ212DRAFT_1312623 [Suillus subaureus]KAG1827483.1 hypothetical protein BJ212DRAFT_1312623 [Suillus subaureus]